MAEKRARKSSCVVFGMSFVLNIYFLGTTQSYAIYYLLNTMGSQDVTNNSEHFFYATETTETSIFFVAFLSTLSL